MVAPYTQATASPNSPQPSLITACSPFSGRTPRCHKRCDIRIPCRFAHPISDLSIQDLPLAAAIGPQAQCDQEHHFLATALTPLAPPFVQLDGLCLHLLAQPDPVELHNSRHIDDGLAMRLLK